MRVRRAVFVLAAFVIALSVPCAARADESTAPILNGSVAVPALGYVTYTTTVLPSEMTNARIAGHVQAGGGTGNDIQLLVFTQTEFLNWKNNHEVTPLYNSGQVTAADINVSVADAGVYVVVLSNTFSMLTPKTVAGDIHLAWTPPAIVANLAGADRFMGIFVPIFAAIVLGGLVTWWAISNSKKKQGPPGAEERKAA